MAQVMVEITGDQAKAEKAYLAAEKSAKSHAATVEASNNKIVASDTKAENSRRKWTEAEREHFKAMKDGAAITQALLTPQERFTAKTKEATALLQKGTITTEIYNRQIAKLTDELADATTNVDRLAEAQKEAFDRELTAAAKRYDDEVARGETIAKRNMTAHEKLAAEQKEVNALYRKGRIDAEAYRRETQRIAIETEKLDDTSSIFDSTITKIAGMATAYVSVSTAIGLASDATDEFAQYQERALELANKLAKAQQEAAKSFVGTTTPEMQALFTNEAQGIAKETGYSDIPGLIDALGAANQTDDSSLKANIEAVKVAAKATTLNKDQTVPLTTALVGMARDTGVADPMKNLGYALSVSKLANTKDPAKVFEILNQPISSAAPAMPGQNKEEIARTSGALFAHLTQQDPKGESAVTATVQFEQKLDEVFDAITTTEQNQKELDTLLAKQDQAGKLVPGSKKKGKSLTSKETKRIAELKDLIANPMVNAANTEDRIVAVQNDKRLYDKLFEKEWGEAKFKQPMKDLVTKGSEGYQKFAGFREKIRFDAAVGEENLEQGRTATPQLAIASSAEAAKAHIEVSKANDIQSQVTASVTQMAADVLSETNTGFLGSVDNIFKKVERGMDTFVDPIGTAQRQVQSRRMDLIGVPGQEDKVAALDATLKAIAEQQKILAEAIKEQNNLVKSQNGKLDEQTGIMKNQSQQPNNAPAPNLIRAQVTAGATRGND